MKLVAFSLLTGLCYLPSLCAKELARYDFESQANVERFQEPVGKDNGRLVVNDQLAHSGKRSLSIEAASTRRLRANAPGPGVLRTQGFISFWFYDRFLVRADGTGTRLGWSLAGDNNEGGSGIYVGQASGGATMEWVIDKQCYGVKRHGGWTKFDIVFNPEQVALYVDGAKVYTPNFTVSCGGW